MPDTFKCCKSNSFCLNCFTVFVTVAWLSTHTHWKLLKGTAAHTMATTFLCSRGSGHSHNLTQELSSNAACSSQFQLLSMVTSNTSFSQSSVLPLTSLSPAPFLLLVPIFFFSPIMIPYFQNMPLLSYNPILLVRII